MTDPISRARATFLTRQEHRKAWIARARAPDHRQQNDGNVMSATANPLTIGAPVLSGDPSLKATPWGSRRGPSEAPCGTVGASVTRLGQQLGGPLLELQPVGVEASDAVRQLVHPHGVLVVQETKGL